MSKFTKLAALSAAVAIPSRDEVLKNDMMIHDATAGLNDKKLDQFKAHLLLVVNHDNPEQHFAEYEAECKKQFNEKAMPGHYRSNKSVLMSCIKYGIAVIGEDGMPRGKTELEKEIKAKKNVKTPMEQALDAVTKLVKASDELTEAELTVLVDDLATHFPQLVVVRKAAA